MRTDSSALAFPKNNSAKDTREKRRQIANAHSEARRQCLELDGGRCMNPECVSNRPYKDGTLPMLHPSRLEAAHVIGRGRGGDWSIGNLITLCSDCHKMATFRTSRLRMAADQFMLRVLTHYDGKENDRWQVSRHLLSLTVERKVATGAIK